MKLSPLACANQWGVSNAIICSIKCCVEEVMLSSGLFNRNGNLLKGNWGIFGLACQWHTNVIASRSTKFRMNSFHAPALLPAVRSAVQVADECFTPFPVLLGISWVWLLFLAMPSPFVANYLGRSLMVSRNDCSTAYSEVNCTLATSCSLLCHYIRIQ